MCTDLDCAGESTFDYDGLWWLCGSGSEVDY